MVPLDVAEVIKVARAYAHLDASRQFLERAMVKIAAGEVHGALQSTTATAVGPSEAVREALHQAAATVEPSVGDPEEGLSAPVDPAAGRLRDSQPRLDYLASQAGVSEMEKEAILRQARALMKRWAGGQGVKGRVGRFLSREVRSPVQMAKVGPRTAVVNVRSPVGPAMAAPKPRQVIPAGAQVATPQQAAAFAPVAEAGEAAAARGVYRTPGRSLTPAEEAMAKIERNAATAPTQQVKRMGKKQKQPGLFSSIAGPLVLPALTVGALYGGKKFIDAASQMASRPMPYSLGHDQFMYGYGPGGQAMF